MPAKFPRLKLRAIDIEKCLHATGQIFKGMPVYDAFHDGIALFVSGRILRLMHRQQRKSMTLGPLAIMDIPTMIVFRFLHIFCPSLFRILHILHSLGGKVLAPEDKLCALRIAE